MKRTASLLALVLAAFALSACNPYIAPYVPDVAVAAPPVPSSADVPDVAVAPAPVPCAALVPGDGAPLPASFVDFHGGAWYDASGAIVATAPTEDSDACLV